MQISRKRIEQILKEEISSKHQRYTNVIYTAAALGKLGDLRRGKVTDYILLIREYLESTEIKSNFSSLDAASNFVRVYRRGDPDLASETYETLKKTIEDIKGHPENRSTGRVLCACVHLMATMYIVMDILKESEGVAPVTETKTVQEQEVLDAYMEGYKKAQEETDVACDENLAPVKDSDDKKAPDASEDIDAKIEEMLNDPHILGIYKYLNRYTRVGGERLAKSEGVAQRDEKYATFLNLVKQSEKHCTKIRTPEECEVKTKPKRTINKRIKKELVKILDPIYSRWEKVADLTRDPELKKAMDYIERAALMENVQTPDIKMLEKVLKDFYPYAKQHLGFNKPVSVDLKSDQANAEELLGKTAYYDPENYSITLFITGRHPKDIMRSLSHELVHHTQNCRGDLQGSNIGEQGYAQKDEHLREMEREAYEQGNMIFRDWEDSIKYGGETMLSNEEKLKEAIRNAITSVLAEEEPQEEEQEDINPSDPTERGALEEAEEESELEEGGTASRRENEPKGEERRTKTSSAMREEQEQEEEVVEEQEEEVVEEQEEEELDEWYQGTLYERLVRKWTK